jgi:enoyl-CoA hydratase/carnithine racemase
MPIHQVSATELVAISGGPTDGGGPAGIAEVLAVDLDSDVPPGRLRPLHVGVPRVVIGLTVEALAGTHPAAGLCDVVLPHDDARIQQIARVVAASPVAATALAMLLRGADERSIDDGLLAESAVYSSLQAGPEFAAWRASRPRRDRPPDGDAVTLTRSGDVLQVVLSRPHVRNALNTTMRDQLVEAFDLAALDPSIHAIHLRGAGEAFCAGGDLDEFGTFPDPASAFVVRLRQSVGRRIAAVADRVTAHLHGACMGSGIELPAFAGTVLADPGAVIGLPEVSLGLIPGAGGTVSLPRRIGRHRTALLALTGAPIDAATALTWGLVDAIASAAEPPDT